MYNSQRHKQSRVWVLVSRASSSYAADVTYIHIDVESNANSAVMANQVFKNLSEPVAVMRVRLFEGDPDGTLWDLTGWSSEGGGTAVEAYAVDVEDSGSGAAILIYGGDWGVRLKPVYASGWDLADAEQWGETHLVLSDHNDINPTT